MSHQDELDNAKQWIVPAVYGRLAMARYWRKKYNVRCHVCGWEGERTGATMHCPCPRCYPLTPGKGGYRTLMHYLSGRGNNSATVGRIED